MTSISLPVGGVSKGALVGRAVEAWGRSRDDLTPEETIRTLGTLDGMMAEWPFSSLPYTFSDYGAGSLSELSGVERTYAEAVALSLAQRCSPQDGAELPADSRTALAKSMALLTSVAAAAGMPTATMTSALAGAGNRGRWPFIHES